MQKSFITMIESVSSKLLVISGKVESSIMIEPVMQVFAEVANSKGKDTSLVDKAVAVLKAIKGDLQKAHVKRVNDFIKLEKSLKS
jgi:hypothetical protein